MAPYHHGDLGRASAEAATALARTGGEEAVSLRKVAARVGVTHRAVAATLGGRDALLGAVAIRAYEALLAAVEGAGTRRAFAEGYVRFALAEPHLYDVAMRRMQTRRDDPALREATLAVVAAARAATGASDAEVKRLWMILHGGLSLHRAGALQPRSDEAMTSFMLEMADG